MTSTPKDPTDGAVDDKLILDACCGGRMMWFNKHHPDALYIDIREEEGKPLVGKGVDWRFTNVKPDIIMDFRKMDLPDEQFTLVAFDPPHMKSAKSFLAQMYGSLGTDWKEDISKGFAECFRVLKPGGVLIFKWNESNIPLKEILALTPVQPLFGHRSGKAMKTHWVTFMKSGHTIESALSQIE